MKSLILFTAFAVLSGCIMLNHHSLERQRDSDGLSDNDRAAWERMRLADPATGEIPEGIRLRELRFAAGLPKADGNYRGTVAQWKHRGPFNVGGRTRALALDILDENHLIAGGVSGGLWASHDGGNSWYRVSNTLDHPGVTSITQDKRAGHQNVWYACSGESYGTSASGQGSGSFYLGDGVLKSVDNGETWAPLPSTAAGIQGSFSTFFQLGWRVLTDPVSSADVVFVATAGAIYRSADGGTSWSVVRGSANNAGAYSYFTDITATTTGVFYCTLSSDGPQKGLYRSTDGINWVNITPTGFSTNFQRCVMGINPNNENEVYFWVNCTSGGLQTYYYDHYERHQLWKYTYLSGDGSGSNGQWEDRSNNLPQTGGEFDIMASQQSYDMVCRVQPGTGNVFLGGINIWRSTDGFTSPNNTSHIGGYAQGTTRPFFHVYLNHHPDQHELLFKPSNPSVLYSTSDGGVRKTSDANASTVVWESLNRGYYTTQFYSVAVDAASPGDSTIIGGLQDNGNYFVNSLDSTASWTMPENGDGTFTAIANGKSAYYVSRQKGVIVKHVLDAAGHSQGFNRIDPIFVPESDYLFVNPFTLDPNNSNIMYTIGKDRIYRNDSLSSIPLTGQWDSIHTGWVGFSSTATSGALITALAVSKVPANRLYYGTNNARIYKVDNANVGAPTHTQVPSPPTSTNSYLSCIAIDPENADHVILVYSNYNLYSIFASTDAGQHWSKVGGNLEPSLNGQGDAPSIRWAAILPNPDGTRKYFVGTSVGLFSADSLVTHTTTNPGTQWVQESPGMIGNAVVDMVVVRPSDRLVVVGTHGNGVFSANYPVPPPAGTNHLGMAKINIKAWPNPATDVLHLSFATPTPQHCSVYLYSATGQLVGQQTSDNTDHLVDIPVAALTPGMYTYTIVSAEGTLGAGKAIIK